MYEVEAGTAKGFGHTRSNYAARAFVRFPSDSDDAHVIHGSCAHLCKGSLDPVQEKYFIMRDKKV